MVYVNCRCSIVCVGIRFGVFATMFYSSQAYISAFFFRCLLFSCMLWLNSVLPVWQTCIRVRLTGICSTGPAVQGLSKLFFVSDATSHYVDWIREAICKTQTLWILSNVLQLKSLICSLLLLEIPGVPQ